MNTATVTTVSSTLVNIREGLKVVDIQLQLQPGGQYDRKDELHSLSLGYTKSHAPLLHHRGELPDALALLAKNILGAGGADDDLSAERRHAHLHTRVSLLRKLLGKKLDNKHQQTGESLRACLCGLYRRFGTTP